MAFAIESYRGVTHRDQSRSKTSGRRQSQRGISLGTAIIGTGVIAFAWAVATAMTLQGVASSYSPNHASLQSSLAPLALARLDTSSKTTHTSPRLVAAMTPIVPASSATQDLAALSPVAKGDRLAASPAVAQFARPKQEDINNALRLALNASAATPLPVNIASATPAATVVKPAVAAVATPATPIDRPVQVALADPVPAPSVADKIAAAPTKAPSRVPPVAARDVVPVARPEDEDQNILPTTAAALVENDTRRADVSVEQTFGLVMPTATPGDMALSNIPLPTMRPAPLPDSDTTPSAKLTRPSNKVLAYARPDAGSLGDDGPSYTPPPALPNNRTRVAIYDITAGRVYLPNGEALEAHSGLGSMIDNPKYVNQKNRGPTPPHTYNLTLRESLFHGVQAIRLNPLNPRAIYGRDGLLAHTYMLGKRGDSNGCVSFKDYNRFLNAFRRGDITQLVVVPSLNGAAPPRSGISKLAFWR